MKKSQLQQIIREEVKNALTEAQERDFMLTPKGKGFFEFMKAWTAASDFDTEQAFTDTYVQEFSKFGAHSELALMLKAGLIKPVKD